MKRLTIVLLATLLVSVALSSTASTQAEQAGLYGSIDWVQNRATATGIGAPPAAAANAAQSRIAARRAAVLDARRNLLEVIRQVRIDSQTRVENLIVTGDVVLSRVEGALVHAAIVAEQQLADGSYRVTMSVPLTGNIARELLQRPNLPPAPTTALPAVPRNDSRIAALEQRVRSLERTTAALVEALRTATAASQQDADAARLNARIAALEKRLADAEAAPPMPPQRTADTTGQNTPPSRPATAASPAPPLPPAQAAVAGAATGIVVDARGTGFAPSLKPRIVSGGSVLYPTASTDFDTGVARGFARYYRDLAQAQQSQRAGTAPHTIRAAASGSDLVVSEEDAALIRNILARGDNPLDQCRLAVVF